MTYNDVQLDVIDQRVRAAAGLNTTTGTMVSRDPNSNNGTALFDGSSVAVPVKVLPHTWARAGDRVTLDRYGSDWVVTGSFGTGMPNEDTVTFNWSDTTTSGSVADIGGTTGFKFVKERGGAATALWVEMNRGTLVVNPGSTTVAVLGVWVDGAGYDVVGITLITNNVHIPFSGALYIAGLGAGTWPVQPVWRRTSGTGTVNTGQSLGLHVREVPYPLTPEM